jgi:hypothetical protein
MSLFPPTRTPRYIWARLRNIVFQRHNPDAPWLAPASLPYIAAQLKQTDQGIEWGSGRSTIWFAHRVAHLYTVEDNAAWRDTVQQIVSSARLGGRVSLEFCETGNIDSYVEAGEGITAATLDFALVDGSTSRDRCTERAITLLKPGGMLIIDNAERYLQLPGTEALHERYVPGKSREPGWTQLESQLMAWQAKTFHNGLSATHVAFKPM